MTTQTMNPFNSKRGTPLSDYTVGYDIVFSKVNLGFVHPIKFIIFFCIIHEQSIKSKEASDHFNKEYKPNASYINTVVSTRSKSIARW